MSLLNTLKKLLTILMVLIASMTLVACSTTDEEAADTPQEEARDEADFDPSDGAG